MSNYEGQSLISRAPGDSNIVLCPTNSPEPKRLQNKRKTGNLHIVFCCDESKVVEKRHPGWTLVATAPLTDFLSPELLHALLLVKSSSCDGEDKMKI